MSYAYDSAEVRALARDAAAADRAEYSAARRDDSGGMCPSGRHEVRRDGSGGGACPCGFTVGRDEL